MKITRRQVALGGTASLLARPALAQTAPIRIGWIAALTGPASTPSIGFNRGVLFAADSINAAGGVGGRQIEIITRDTQSDPTKAVNATQEFISKLKVDACWGPVNSGEALATTAIMARGRMPNVHPCSVDTLIDPVKYPNAFRTTPANSQWDNAVRGYALNILKVKKVTVFGDTTGYGVSSVKTSTAAFIRDGAEVVSQANIDATQADLTPEMLRARDAGAQAIIVWSVSTGMIARMLNARAAMNWNVPFVGHPALAAGDIAGLLTRPQNWQDVYAVGYKSCSYDASGRLPPHSQELVDRLAGKVSLTDSLLWWVSSGYDAIALIADAVRATGNTDPAAIIGYWNTLQRHPGYFGDYTFSPTEHNGYPTSEVVMSAANSARSGSFALAPGYA